MKNTITIETGATGAFALSACVETAATGLRPRRTGLMGAIVLRSALAASRDASIWNSVDVPTPVPVRPGGAHG